MSNHISAQSQDICNYSSFIGCSPKWTSKIMGVMLVISALLLLLYIFQPVQTEINMLLIDVDSAPLRKTNERYLSVCLDSSLIAKNFEGLDMRSKKLHMVMLPLGGSYLRIGGKMADRLLFAPRKSIRKNDIGYVAYENRSREQSNFEFINYPNFTMSGFAWKALNRLAIDTNFTILFDLNALRREKNGEWDASNAEELISFSNKNEFNLIWELGNEPNSYRKNFNYEVTGRELAKNFKKLRSILNKYPRYKNSMLVGPDITKPKYYNEEPRQFLLDFLNEVDFYINAITWHQYYFKGQDAHLTSFLSIDVFDSLEHEIFAIKSAANQAYYINTPIWLGETSSASGGGSPLYSDKFVATFIWLDKLGLAARSGIDLILRQSLIQGHYALLDSHYNPNPDWWISVLYKKLVGPEVRDCFLRANERVRLYCHNAQQPNEYLNEPATVVFGINVNYLPAFVRVQKANSNFRKPLEILEFVLQTKQSIVEKDVYLNNILLKISEDGRLPIFKAKNLTSSIIKMPPYSLGFWLIPVSNCK